MFRFDCFDPWHAWSEQLTTMTLITSSENEGYAECRPSAKPASFFVVVVPVVSDDEHANTNARARTGGRRKRVYRTIEVYQEPARRRSSIHTLAGALVVAPAAL